MASQVFDIKFGKGMSRGQSNEHLRNFSKEAYEAKRAHNFDPTREHLNFEVKPGGIIMPLDKADAIDARIRRNLAERGIKDPNEGLKEKDEKRRNTVLNIIFQGSRERMRELAFGEQEIEENDLDFIADNSNVKRMPEIEEWAKDMYRFAAEKFGEKNIAAFVCHLDEKNPHIHCTVIPVGMIKGKERISAKSLTGQNKHESRKILHQWHDELAEVNKKWGLDRGKDIQTTGARHRTTEEYWKWLSETCSRLENEKDGLEKEVALLKKEKDKAEKTVKGLTTMISNLDMKCLELENDIAGLEQELYLKSVDTEKKRKENAAKQAEIDEKKQQLEELKAKLADKKQKLEIANQKLSDLGLKYRKVDEQITQTKQYLSRFLPDARQKSQSKAESIAWNIVSQELKRGRQEMAQMKEGMSPEELKVMNRCEDALFSDEHLLKDFSDRGGELVAVAANLFLGFVEGAMKYAQSSGGGGGGPTSGWGRKKDEDDTMFMGRCMLMAVQMMRPVSHAAKQSVRPRFRR